MLDLVGEPDAAILHVRFDERGVETVHGRILRHWQPKGPAPATADLPTALLLDSTQSGDDGDQERPVAERVAVAAKR